MLAVGRCYSGQLMQSNQTVFDARTRDADACPEQPEVTIKQFITFIFIEDLQQ